MTDHVLGAATWFSPECPAPGQQRDAAAVVSGRPAGQCDLPMMASCQFKKQSESSQLSAGAGRGIRAFLFKDRTKLSWNGPAAEGRAGGRGSVRGGARSGASPGWASRVWPLGNSRHPDAARRQRPAGQKTKSSMCPCGPRGRSGGRGRRPARAGPPKFGRAPGGAFVRQPLAGKLWRSYLCEVPCWCAGRRRASALRAGGRAGEGGSIWGPGALARAPGAAPAEGPGERGPELAARSPRPGACAWEVCAFAFEVELLPCLNYVRAKPWGGTSPSSAACGRRGLREAPGWAGAGPVVPAQVREEGRGSPPAALAPARSSPRELSSRPRWFYLPTDPPGSISVCCLGAFLGGHWMRCPRGRRSLGTRGGRGAADCRGRAGEAFCCFRRTRRVRRAPPHLGWASARTFGGPSPDDRQKSTVGKFRGSQSSYKGKWGLCPNCACACFLCVFACGRGNREGRGLFWLRGVGAGFFGW